MKGRKPAAKRPTTGSSLPSTTTGTITRNPPAWLSKYAAEVWWVTIDDLAAQGKSLPLQYLESFTGYCQSAGAAREADEILGREGLTIDGGREGLKRHPAVVIRTSALQSLRSFAESLGLTPASAGRFPQATVRKPTRFDDL